MLVNLNMGQGFVRVVHFEAKILLTDEGKLLCLFRRD